MTAYLAIQEDDFPLVETSSIQSNFLQYGDEPTAHDISVRADSPQIITVIFSTAARELDLALEPKDIKRYWRTCGTIIGRTIGVISGDIDALKENVSSLILYPSIEVAGYETESVQGFYPITPGRHVLFSGKLKFRIADLPKWEPRAGIIIKKKRMRNAR